MESTTGQANGTGNRSHWAASPSMRPTPSEALPLLRAMRTGLGGRQSGGAGGAHSNDMAPEAKEHEMTPQDRKRLAYARYHRSVAQRELRERLAYATDLAGEMEARDYEAYLDDPQGADPLAIAQADAAYLAKVLRGIDLGTILTGQVA